MSRMHTPPMMNQGDKKVDVIKNLKQIAVSMKRYFFPIIISIVFILAYVVIAVISPNVLKTLTNVITDNCMHQKEIPTGFSAGGIGYYAVILLILYIVSAFSSFIASFIMTTMSQRYSQQLRSQISKKINVVPLSYFDTKTIGDILSILTNDVDMISQSLQQSLSMVFSSVFMLIGSIVAMFVSSWQMALVAVGTIPVMVILLGVILGLAGPQFAKRQKMVGVVDGLVEENYNGQLIVKVFNAEEKKVAEFDKQNEELGKAMFHAEFFGGMIQPMMSFMSYFAYAAVCIAGGLLVNTEGSGVTMGTITAFLMYVNLFQSPLSQLGQAMNSLQSAAASGERVFSFLDEEELSDESSKVDLLEDEKVLGKVEFDHVSFSYDGKREIIHDFSAVVQPGMKVAIVGPTGAGKTTMVNLLMRFYEVSSGDIRIDGVSIHDMTRTEIHELFAMVLQDTWIFDGTLRENLVYNTKEVTPEKIDKVIHDAHLTHFVRSLPGGLDYEIKDGGSISGGQKQLITIARAMLKPSRLLILDEATSNVDTRTEEKIQESMDRLSKGKTSFVIAHRLSTIKNADLILVMKDGNIVETGNHDSLMKQNGFYASLYNSQFDLNAENVID